MEQHRFNPTLTKEVIACLGETASDVGSALTGMGVPDELVQGVTANFDAIKAA